MLHSVRHAHAFERLLHARFALRRRHARTIGQWQFDILVDSQIADQVEALKDETYLLVADARALREAKVFYRLAIELVRSAGWCIEQADDRQQCRLPAT